MSAPRPIGFWLALVDRLIDERVGHTLDEHGVTRRQWQLLSILATEPTTGEQLSAAIRPFSRPDAAGAITDAGVGVGAAPGEPETAAENLDELIESEWVVFDDERYDLTPRGHTLFQKLRDVLDESRGRVADGVAPDDYETTVATLERMASNLGWRDDA